ncbi:MAG: hypothetical protein LZF62_240030 [Nitrospira sp.]|nr:MAG: hypothetical protein LZF62_240030 [Nitrospira sp.]
MLVTVWSNERAVVQKCSAVEPMASPRWTHKNLLCEASKKDDLSIVNRLGQGSGFR